MAGDPRHDTPGGTERDRRAGCRRAAHTHHARAGRRHAQVVEVDNLVLHADQRGQRIGRRLLAAVVEWARQRRAAQVEVIVGDANRDARRFYEAFGFAATVDRLVLAA